MIVSTKAIVFSTFRYGEADLISRCFTEKEGLKSYLLRGILKSRRSKVNASLFQSLTQLDIVAYHKNKGSLEYIREAKLLQPYSTLHSDIQKSTVVMFLAEVLRNAIREEEANVLLFDYLQRTLTWFDAQEKAVNFHLLFLLNLTRYLGFYPDTSHLEARFFNMIDGRFQNTRTNDSCLEGSDVDILRQLLGTDFDALGSKRMNQVGRTGFLNLLLNYYQVHLQGFHKPKSLAVLNEIYT